ncbi:MAG: hypothetical protein KAR83_00285 [Thermodesulfovibrionales bacterium]|nr:hypothetical protein [Thermodesulfovibrionales bacterium]
MDYQDFKLYGLCVMRLKHQIALARERGRMCNGRAVLESFCTGEVEEIVDLLELYDLKDNSRQGLSAMLEELAGDASLFVREPLAFDYDESGELCLYLLEEAQVKADPAEVKTELETAGVLTTEI